MYFAQLVCGHGFDARLDRVSAKMTAERYTVSNNDSRYYDPWRAWLSLPKGTTRQRSQICLRQTKALNGNWPMTNWCFAYLIQCSTNQFGYIFVIRYVQVVIFMYIEYLLSLLRTCADMYTLAMSLKFVPTLCDANFNFGFLLTCDCVQSKTPIGDYFGQCYNTQGQLSVPSQHITWVPRWPPYIHTLNLNIVFELFSGHISLDDVHHCLMTLSFRISYRLHALGGQCIWKLSRWEYASYLITTQTQCYIRILSILEALIYEQPNQTLDDSKALKS